MSACTAGVANASNADAAACPVNPFELKVQSVKMICGVVPLQGECSELKGGFMLFITSCNVKRSGQIEKIVMRL